MKKKPAKCFVVFSNDLMPLDLNRFQVVRPFIYHLTSTENLAHIRETRTLDLPRELMRLAGRVDLLCERRRHHEQLGINGSIVMLRDQAPLHRGNVDLGRGYSFEELVEDLNSRIFFWPGAEIKPIEYGVRHFERYRSESPVIIKAMLESVLETNEAAEPQFCRYNSGSPRCSGGIKSPRGRETFLPASRFEGTPSDVVEVTFAQSVRLPENALVGDHPTGPWRPLF